MSADVLFSGTADGKIVKVVGRRLHTVTRLGKLPCGEKRKKNVFILLGCVDLIFLLVLFAILYFS